MLSPTEFSKEDAQRAKDLRDALVDAGHEPDEVHVAEDVRMGQVIEAVYGVEGDEEALNTATEVIEDLPEDKLPDTFYYANGRATTEPEVGPADLGVVWEGLDEAEVERETTEWPADVGPADFPELWRDTEETTDMGFATLVELMTEHVEDHTLERMRRAVEAECTRREAWDSHEATRTLSLGSRTLVLLREVPDESEDLPPGVAETSDEDPRGDA